MAGRYKITSCILLVGIILATVFILSNSLNDYEASHNLSENITDIIISDNNPNSEYIAILVRKIAHIVEFSALGVFTIAFSTHFRKCYVRSVFGYALFYVLSVAVADEHIQSFSDRTSSTGDIILDFCGALLGFFIGWLIIKAYAKIKSYFQRSEQEKKNGREKTTRA